MRNKRVVVTGGAGFIGSNIAKTLCESNNVTIIDNLLTGKCENLADIEGRVEFIEGDINDLKLLKKVFESADYVLHQAALPSVQRSVADPLATNKNNIDGTLTVLVAARDCSVKRVVFASSSSIYGDTPEIPKNETMTPMPLSPYAVTKLVGEQYCRVFYKVYGLETVSLRYFNVFGPGQDPTAEYAAVIPKFLEAIRKREHPVIYGDGDQTRDFVYVGDVVRANVLACEAAEAPGRAINIATGKGTSLNRLIDILKKVRAVDIEPIYTHPQPGDIRDSVADISLAKRLLDFVPQMGVEEGLRATLRSRKGKLRLD